MTESFVISADLLVAEVVLKLELQHFLLTRRERGDDAEEKAACLRLLDVFVRRRSYRRLTLENFNGRDRSCVSPCGRC